MSDAGLSDQDKGDDLDRRRRSNVANLLRDILNEQVPLREGDKVRLVPSCEAIIRLLVMNGRRGDPKALTTVMKLLEMTGRLKEKPVEQQRKLRLPKPVRSKDEYLLLLLPENEKERDRLLKKALEEEGIPYDPNRPSNKNLTMDTLYGVGAGGTQRRAELPFKRADRLYEQHDLEGAAKSYRDHVHTFRGRIEQGLHVEQATAELPQALDRLGRVAKDLLRIRSFFQAYECAEDVIKCGFTGLSAPATLAIACLHRGRLDEARSVLQQNRGKFENGRSWETIISHELTELEKLGITHPDVEEVRALIRRPATEGVANSQVAAAPNIEDKKELPPSVEAPQPVVLPKVQDDLASGHRMVAEGQLSEAVEIYCRRIAICDAGLLSGRSPHASRLIDERNVAIGCLGDIALTWILDGEHALALDCIDRALSILPDTPILMIRRAHILMFDEKSDQARLIYLKYKSLKIGDTTGLEMIESDFGALLHAGLRHQLMHEILES